VVYEPLPGITGADTFTFQVCDSDLCSARATITVEITNGTPTAQDIWVAALKTEATTITLLGTDPDGDRLAFQLDGTSAPQQGTLGAVNGASVVYTPNASLSADTDSFGFTTRDSASATSASATVHIKFVDALTPVTATSQTFTIPTRQATTRIEQTQFAVTLSGDDPAGGPLTFKIVDFPVYQDSGYSMGKIAGGTYQRWNGTAWESFTDQISSTVAASGIVSSSGSPVTVIYTPQTCQTGRFASDSFTYVAITSTGQQSALATVTFNVKQALCSSF